MFVFRKIWRALLSCNTRLRFALLLYYRRILMFKIHIEMIVTRFISLVPINTPYKRATTNFSEHAKIESTSINTLSTTHQRMAHSKKFGSPRCSYNCSSNKTSIPQMDTIKDNFSENQCTFFDF